MRHATASIATASPSMQTRSIRSRRSRRRRNRHATHRPACINRRPAVCSNTQSRIGTFRVLTGAGRQAYQTILPSGAYPQSRPEFDAHSAVAGYLLQSDASTFRQPRNSIAVAKLLMPAESRFVRSSSPSTMIFSIRRPSQTAVTRQTNDGTWLPVNPDVIPKSHGSFSWPSSGTLVATTPHPYRTLSRLPKKG